MYSNAQYATLRSTFYNIYTHEGGITQLWKGMLPRMFRIICKAHMDCAWVAPHFTAAFFMCCSCAVHVLSRCISKRWPPCHVQHPTPCLNIMSCPSVCPVSTPRHVSRKFCYAISSWKNLPVTCSETFNIPNSCLIFDNPSILIHKSQASYSPWILTTGATFILNAVRTNAVNYLEDARKWACFSRWGNT
jgi:hypothetical protein